MCRLQKYNKCKGLCIASSGPDQPAEVVSGAPKHMVLFSSLFATFQRLSSFGLYKQSNSFVIVIYSTQMHACTAVKSASYHVKAIILLLVDFVPVRDQRCMHLASCKFGRGIIFSQPACTCTS